MLSTATPTRSRVIHWEALKRKALDEFLFRTQHGSAGYDPADAQFLALISSLNMERPKHPLTVLEEWREYGWRIIENWDIRLAMRLVECFPSCLPRHLHKLRPVLEMEDSEESPWVLVFSWNDTPNQ